MEDIAVTRGGKVLEIHAGKIPDFEHLIRWRDNDGITEVEFVEPIHLDQRAPMHLLSWITFLRDAATALVEVRWDGTVSVPTSTIERIVHLAPPASISRSAQGKLWAELHDGSRLFYRRGPGFVMLKDVRRPGSPCNITLDEPSEISLFSRISQPTKLEDLAEFRRPLREFLSSGLVCQAAGIVVGVATQMRRWPIPYTAV